ncbi:MAG: DUF58 domain-containing protein [Lysobacteraceae bacterium]
MRTTLQTAWRRLSEWAEKRLPSLTRLRAEEPLPIRIHRRRLYVLPTRYGLFLSVLLFGMLLGALNYNNNPALMLTFLMASVMHTALLAGWLALLGLQLDDVSAESVHVGEPIRWRLQWRSGGDRARRGLRLRLDAREFPFEVLDHQIQVEIQQNALRRGWQSLPRLGLSTRHPLGVFRIWSWLHPSARCLVYPALEANAPPLPLDGVVGPPRRQRGPSEDVHGLRDYQRGDPWRLIAWKRSAQIGHAVVREYETPTLGDVHLRWSQLNGLPNEQRISRMARWIVDAERRSLRSTLELPHLTLGPARGPAHLHACLRELALMP